MYHLHADISPLPHAVYVPVMDPDGRKFGNFLARLLAERRWSKVELERRTGIPRLTIDRHIADDGVPDVAMRGRYADGLKLPDVDAFDDLWKAEPTEPNRYLVEMEQRAAERTAARRAKLEEAASVEKPANRLHTPEEYAANLHEMHAGNVRRLGEMETIAKQIRSGRDFDNAQAAIVNRLLEMFREMVKESQARLDELETAAAPDAPLGKIGPKPPGEQKNAARTVHKRSGRVVKRGAQKTDEGD